MINPVIEMKETEEILEKLLPCGAKRHSPKEEFQEMGKEDKELYIFIRGGFAAK